MSIWNYILVESLLKTFKIDFSDRKYYIAEQQKPKLLIYPMFWRRLRPRIIQTLMNLLGNLFIKKTKTDRWKHPDHYEKSNFLIKSIRWFVQHDNLVKDRPFVFAQLHYFLFALHDANNKKSCIKQSNFPAFSFSQLFKKIKSSTNT